MRVKSRKLVVTFHTTTAAMGMELACGKAGLPGRLIPGPREITAGCGLSWKADPAQKEQLEAALTGSDMVWQEMHIIEI